MGRRTGGQADPEAQIEGHWRHTLGEVEKEQRRVRRDSQEQAQLAQEAKQMLFSVDQDQRQKEHTRRRNNPNAPVVLWLQGGPGASSLHGMFTEIGPFTIDEDLKVVPRADGDYSWNQKYSLLFIDNPVGVGWSWSDEACGPPGARWAIYAYIDICTHAGLCVVSGTHGTYIAHLAAASLGAASWQHRPLQRRFCQSALCQRVRRPSRSSCVAMCLNFYHNAPLYDTR